MVQASRLIWAWLPAVPLLVGSSLGDDQDNSSGADLIPFNLNAVAVVERRGQQNFCSGALVSNRLVLTALHCVQDIGELEPNNANSFRVGFGPSRGDPETQWRDVQDIRVPGESYAGLVDELRGNDIALLVLNSPIEETPFLIPDQTLPPAEDTELVIAGFGEDRYGHVGTRHTTRVRVTERSDTGFAFVGGGCLGDSGGPILDHNGRFVGLVSLGTTKHCVPSHTRFAQPLAPFSDFITDQLLRGGRNN